MSGGMGQFGGLEPPTEAIGNIEAEQALLGAILYDNEALSLVDGTLPPDAFLEPFHGRLYDRMREIILAGSRADPITLADRFPGDEGFGTLGGVGYLADLVDHAPPSANAPDYAGVIRDAAQRRNLIRLSEGLARAARGRDGDIPTAELIETAERELLRLQTHDRRTTLVSASEAVRRMLEQYENPNISPGVKTGLASLDEAIGDIQPGELVLLAARPSMGKSALAGCIAMNVSRKGLHPDGARLGVIEINGEMTPEQMMRRHVSDLAFDLVGRDGPEYRDIRRRKLEDFEQRAFYQAASELRELRTLYSVKKTGMTVSMLRALIRRQVSAWSREGIKLGLVVIDHVGLIRPDRQSFSRTQDQNEVAIALKELADDLGIPILALAQLNRNVESRDDKRPTLPDLKDSGGWEENADVVIGVFREAYYANREQEPKGRDAQMAWEAAKESKIVDAILLKVREGKIGTVKLWSDIGRNVIRSSEPDNIYGHVRGQSDGLFGTASAAYAARPGTAVAPAPSPPADLPPDPPLSAYEPDEFA